MKQHDDTTVPTLKGSVDDALRAMFKTPPPPVGHPSTRKQKPKPKKKRPEHRVGKGGGRGM